MDRSSSHRDAWNELVTLSWCALEQAQTIGGVIDDETFLFFTAPRHAQTSCPIKPSTQQNLPASEEQENQGMDMNGDSPDTTSQTTQRRLEKLLPRPFSSSPADTSSTRKLITASTAMPHLSNVSLYQEGQATLRPQHWAVFTYLPSAVTPSPKETFIGSVVKAMNERLSVEVTQYSCYDPSFALHLPIAIDDCEVVLFFVDSHLKSALSTLLETVQTFSPSSQPIETPFTVLGSIHGRPLRALILHTGTHEDPAIKGALWQSLKALATLPPPQ